MFTIILKKTPQDHTIHSIMQLANCHLTVKFGHFSMLACIQFTTF